VAEQTRKEKAVTVGTLVVACLVVAVFVALLDDAGFMVHYGRGSVMTGDQLSTAEREQAKRIADFVVALIATVIAFIIGWNMRGNIVEEQ